MPNPRVFCNSPWYELHIYWDGSLGVCCQESHRLYGDREASGYNIKNMTIPQWYDSDPVRQMRLRMLESSGLTSCSRCYSEEATGHTSRRHKANQKSVIFTRSNFRDSYLQSPHVAVFEGSRNEGHSDKLPVDLHVDLGNHCNLACKMCHARASSKIASQLHKWGELEDRSMLGTDWTKDEATWQRFLQEVESIGIKNIHFMGGETMLTKRFHDFLDHMIDVGHTDINISFVTNGTVFDRSLIEKLKKFGRIGVEVSIESLSPANAYVRQGTDTQLVLHNIKQYREHEDQQLSVAIRAAVSSLTIGSYHTLLSYCLQKGLVIKPLIVERPEFMQVRHLPTEIKQRYLDHYHRLHEELDGQDIENDFNESDQSQYVRIVKLALEQARGLLRQPCTEQSEQMLSQLVSHCAKWDKVYDLRATEIYPELLEIFERHRYAGI